MSSVSQSSFAVAAPHALPLPALAEAELSLGRSYFEDARLLAHACRWEGCLQLLAVSARHAARSLLASRAIPLSATLSLPDLSLPDRLVEHGFPPALADSCRDLLAHARLAGYPGSPPLDRDAAKTRFFTAQELLDYVAGCLA